MPPETDRIELSPDVRSAFTSVASDYEVSLYADGRLTFTCARCRLVFDRDDFAPMAGLVNALNAHRSSHRLRAAKARAYRAAKVAESRDVDASGQPHQMRAGLDRGD